MPNYQARNIQRFIDSRPMVSNLKIPQQSEVDKMRLSTPQTPMFRHVSVNEWLFDKDGDVIMKDQ